MNPNQDIFTRMYSDFCDAFFTSDTRLIFLANNIITTLRSLSETEINTLIEKHHDEIRVFSGLYSSGGKLSIYEVPQICDEDEDQFYIRTTTENEIIESSSIPLGQRFGTPKEMCSVIISPKNIIPRDTRNLVSPEIMFADRNN
jgi:hypothetical protein